MTSTFAAWLISQAATDAPAGPGPLALARAALADADADPSLVAAWLGRPEIDPAAARAALALHRHRGSGQVLAAWLVRAEQHRPTVLARLRSDPALAAQVAWIPAARDEHLRAVLDAHADPATGDPHTVRLVARHPHASVTTRVAALELLDGWSDPAEQLGVLTALIRAVREAGPAAASRLARTLRTAEAVPALAEADLDTAAADAVVTRWVLPALAGPERLEARLSAREVLEVVSRLAPRLSAQVRDRLAAAATAPGQRLHTAVTLAETLGVAGDVDWGAFPARSLLSLSRRDPLRAWLDRHLADLPAGVDPHTLLALAETFPGSFTELLAVASGVGAQPAAPAASAA